jgi:hypothetical protein
LLATVERDVLEKAVLKAEQRTNRIIGESGLVTCPSLLSSTESIPSRRLQKGLVVSRMILPGANLKLCVIVRLHPINFKQESKSGETMAGKRSKHKVKI